MHTAHNHFDAIIVGSGIVGSATALALAKQNRNVLLLEKSAARNNILSQDAATTAIDARVFAISRASENFLKYLGAWHHIQNWRCCAYKYMHVWDAQAKGELRFSHHDIQAPNLGHIIENSVIKAACHAAAAKYANWQFKNNVSLTSLEFKPSRRVVIGLDNQQQYSADLLIVADGANSATRKMLGIAVASKDYMQQAIVATISTEKEHGFTAWQRFLATGPLAILPLSNGQSSIVWSADNELADNLLKQSDDRFISLLETASERRLGAVKSISQRYSFALFAKHSQEYVRPNLALVGDAAHQIHPLAGQGVNLGLLDAATLAEEFSNKSSLNLYQPLRRYARRRRHANTITQQSMTAFYYLFKNHAPELNQLRGQGLSMVNKSHILRSKFAHYATGLAMDVPVYAQATKL